MEYLGDFNQGDSIFCDFTTYGGDNESITITGLAVTDIEIYKDANMTQRASDAGYALVDTDGIDLDGVTGYHGFTIDTGDDTTADFFLAADNGSQYTVIVNAITVNAQTVVLGFRFTLGKVAATVSAGLNAARAEAPGLMVGTDIDTVNSQTSLVLSEGSADNDAYNGCTVVIRDQTTGVQKAFALADDYVGSTRTLTLASTPVFTVAAGDLVDIMAPVGTGATASEVRAEMDSNSTQLATLNAGLIFGAAVTGTLSTTVATTDLTGYADDQLIGRVIIWTSGDCEGEATDITDYASTGGTLTFTALTTAPANGDTFKVV